MRKHVIYVKIICYVATKNLFSVLSIYYNMFWLTWPSSDKYKAVCSMWEVNCNIKFYKKEMRSYFYKRVILARIYVCYIILKLYIISLS